MHSANPPRWRWTEKIGGVAVALSMLLMGAAWGQTPSPVAPPARPTKPSNAPTAANPTTANPTTAKPAAAYPTAANPAAAKPTTANPTTAKPAAAYPAAANPADANAAAAKPAAANAATAEVIPPALDSYLGREIAQTMHFSGAPWLIRENREDEERCSIMLGQLGVKPGMTVCDMGCGNGFYSLQLAKMVGPQGRVLCVDIQPEMLRLLERRAVDQGIDNLVPILGAVHDPRLPEASVDLILLVDVYHEFSHPEQMLKGMHAALKPDGVIALLEYRAEDPNVPIKPLHKMSKKQILKEFNPNGFRLVREFNRLPWQHLMFFGLIPQE